MMLLSTQITACLSLLVWRGRMTEIMGTEHRGDHRQRVVQRVTKWTAAVSRTFRTVKEAYLRHLNYLTARLAYVIEQDRAEEIQKIKIQAVFLKIH
jgi:hypothetical protein